MRAKTWVEINAESYKNNIQAIRSLLDPEVAFCSVVKANAYGHGLEQITKIALQNNVEHFAVDSIDEAQELRALAPDATIFILGYTVEDRITDVVALGCVQTVYDERTVGLLGAEALKQQRQAYVNVKIETGTQRQGVLERDFKHLLASIEKQKGSVELVSLASHFSSSEEVTKPHITLEQNQKFNELIEVCKTFGLKPSLTHISCSASTLIYPETHHSMVRVGLSQYGMWPSDGIKTQKSNKQPSFKLRSIITWKTRVAQVKDIASGTPVGYDQTFISDRPMRIAVLPVGYYDGLVRSLSDKAHVIVKGQKCRILGNICMNMFIVDISVLPQVKPGDTVTLIGRDGMHEITAEDHARWSNTINYEVTTRINPLLPRIII
jgi:alanine racemase